MANDLEKRVEEVIKEHCIAVGFTTKKPFEMLATLAVARKMSLDKYGAEHWEEDSPTQLKVAELLLRLMGLVDKKVEDVKSATVTVRVSAEDVSRMEAITRELGELQRRLRSEPLQMGQVVEAEVVR